MLKSMLANAGKIELSMGNINKTKAFRYIYQRLI